MGGLGFVVWDDIVERGLHFRKYSLHSRVVLIMLVGLVAGGTFLFIIFEHNNLFANMSPGQELMAAIFTAVTPRTAGFNTTELGDMTQAGKLLTCFLYRRQFGIHGRRCKDHHHCCNGGVYIL